MTAKEPTRATRGQDDRRLPTWVLSVLVLGAAGYASLFLSAIRSADDELLHALTIAPILIALTVPFALKIARSDGDPTLAGIVLAGVVAKLLAAWVRYWVAFDYYGGFSDSLQYHEVGRVLAPEYRRFDFATDIGSLVGTGFIKMFTGVVYGVFGTSLVAGFMVFAWIGFLGLLLMARAFRIGVPDGDSRRYLIAVLFLPTLLYWPSAIGKEAWMMLALGLCAYGVANLFQRRSAGVVTLGLGLIAVLLVRPHIALIVFIALALALLLRRAPARSYAAPLLRVLGVAALVVLGVVIIGRSSAFLDQALKIPDASIGAQLERTAERTSDGGSAFTPVTVNTPLDMVPATITVFFRPFPFEVSSVQEVATSAEGLLLIGLLVASRKRLRSIPRMIRTTPYVTYCIGYLIPFVFAFASFANFGILARQRSQAIPFLLVFLALPKYRDVATASATKEPVSEAAPAPTVPAAPVAQGSRRRTHLVAVAASQGVTSVGEGTRRRSRRPAVAPAPPPTRPQVSTGTAFPPPPRSRP